MQAQNFSKTLKRQAGYTIDQTILIVAVIAILVTMIIGSVGWDLLTRAGGTKLQSHLVQFENAAGSFFSQYGLWPQDVITGSDAVRAFNVLTRADAATDPSFTPGNEFRNYLPAYPVSSPSQAAQHPFGSGGDVGLETETELGQTFVVFELADIPADEYRRAEEGIDGNVTGTYWQTGRLRTDGENPEPGNDRLVTLRYFANVTN